MDAILLAWERIGISILYGLFFLVCSGKLCATVKGAWILGNLYSKEMIGTKYGRIFSVCMK